MVDSVGGTVEVRGDDGSSVVESLVVDSVRGTVEVRVDDGGCMVEALVD